VTDRSSRRRSRLIVEPPAESKWASVPVLIRPRTSYAGCRSLFRVRSVDTQLWLESVSPGETDPQRHACTLLQVTAGFGWLAAGAPDRTASNRQFGQNLAPLTVPLQPPDRSDAGHRTPCACGCGATVAPLRKFMNQEHYSAWLSQVRYFGRNRKSQPR
jgi:hypothetical protein